MGSESHNPCSGNASLPWTYYRSCRVSRFRKRNREVRRALGRYIQVDVERRRLGWSERSLSPRQGLKVQAKLGDDLLYIRAVVARSEEHQAAFQGVMRRLPIEKRGVSVLPGFESGAVLRLREARRITTIA